MILDLSILIIRSLQLAIFLSIFQQWTGFMANHPLSYKLNNMLDQLYRPIRKFTNNIPGIFDFAPMVLLFILYFIERLLVSYIYF